ncbi:MAG TPA: glycosyltransferase family 4 protein [Bacteroidales bacterium]|nr:glycosyltransferase family 4 protein [Bacteroidales bacterium]HQI69886.1 glycosyltransferase family 4 protein [Bacteroidales bacterium]
MNILQLCNKSPFPPKEGGPIAMYNLGNGLMQQGHNVDILTMNTFKFSVDVDALPVDYRYKTRFTAVFVDTRIKYMDAFLNLFSSKSFHVQRFDCQEFRNTLIHILKNKNYDFVQLETIYVAPYIDTIRKYSKAKIVLRSHNIEHLIWQRYARTIGNPVKRKYINYLTAKLKKYEMTVFGAVDGIACITSVDADYIKSRGFSTPLSVVPFGLECEKYKVVPSENCRPSFFHLGSMDWMPNQEAIRWFLDNCMPELAALFPETMIYLAGRNMPSWIYNYKFPNLKIVGEVEDAAEFMQSKTVMFVPLLSGSGVRVKIIEGMALGKTIISTSVGAEGIHYTDGENLLIADSPEVFIEKFRLCINDHVLCTDIGTNARKLIEAEYDISVTTHNLIKLYQAIQGAEN